MIPIDIIFIGISLIAGITVYFQSSKPTYLRLFPVFLFITFVNEISASWLSTRGFHTTVLYNVYNLFQFNFYLYLLFKSIQNALFKRVSFYLLVGYLAFTVLNFFVFQGMTVYNSITYAFGCLMIVAFGVYYFFELFMYKNYVNLLREPSFWISTGLLFYYSCSFPLISSINFIINSSKISLEVLQNVIQFLNVMLYSLFTIAFLCRLKTPKFT